MQVILNKDVAKVGRAGAVVQVKEGFARNFLFPQNLAQPATAGSLKKLEEEKKAAQAQSAKNKEESIQLKTRLNEVSLTITALAKNDEKLYGSIGALEIVQALNELGFSIDKNMIDLAEPIKSLGIHEVPVKLHPEVVALVKLEVVRK